MGRPDFVTDEHLAFLSHLYKSDTPLDEAVSRLADEFGLSNYQSGEAVQYWIVRPGQVARYSFLFPLGLRKQYEALVTYPATLKDVVVKALEMALPVLQGGHAGLDEFCKAISLETLDDWTKENCP